MNDAVQDVNPAEGSAVPGPSAPSNVVTIACSCLGEPHEYDTVTLASEVPLELGVAAAFILQTASDVAATLGSLSSIYLRFGVVGWSLVDKDGKAEPLQPDNILRRLTYSTGGYEVAEAANSLYNAAVMRPLLLERAKSSASGPQGGSTPPTNGSGRKRRVPSTPSSPTATAGQAFAAPAS